MIRDIVNKNENVDAGTYEMKKLKEVVPQCFNEDNTFDMEKFQSLLKGKINIRNEGYGLHFLGKSYARMLASLDTETVITPNEEHNAKDENKDSENIYITGDNLDALKHLLKSYIRKIKCIYIDPPYNTGTDGFVYKDSFDFKAEELAERLSIDEEEAQRVLDLTKRGSASHSAWLTFMYPRLLLARDLLTDDGVIFISIDDNEQANLKILCDEIFGEENFLTCITRTTGTPTGGGFDGLVNEIDYMLVYSKNVKETFINGLPMNETDSKIYDQIDEKGKYLIRPLRRTGGEDRREDRPTMYFPIIAPDKTEVYPIGPTGYESRWICSAETVKKLENNGLLEWKKVKKQDKEIWQVYQKFYLENRMKSPGNLWNDIEGNKKATRDIRLLFDNDKIFDFPKPLGLIEKVLKIGSNEEDIVLDFFSGSATTAHAVMDLNAKDNGNRKFIMVQLAEEIAENKPAYKAGYRTIDEIGRERIVRAAKKIREENPDTAVDLGFKHYVLNEVDDNTFDTLEQFKPEETLISDNHVLNMFGAKTVLTTWLVYDGYGFNADVNVVKFGNYTAYHCQKHLYFIYDDFDDDAMQALIEKYDGDGNFNPENLIVFGYSFSWTQMQMLKVNLHRLKVTDRNIAVNIDIRY